MKISQIRELIDRWHQNGVIHMRREDPISKAEARIYLECASELKRHLTSSSSRAAECCVLLPYCTDAPEGCITLCFRHKPFKSTSRKAIKEERDKLYALEQKVNIRG